MGCDAALMGVSFPNFQDNVLVSCSSVQDKVLVSCSSVQDNVLFSYSSVQDNVLVSCSSVQDNVLVSCSSVELSNFKLLLTKACLFLVYRPLHQKAQKYQPSHMCEVEDKEFTCM